jgi:hypothetical protein
MEVRAADPAGAHPQQDLPGHRRGFRHFLNGKLIFAFAHDGFHRNFAPLFGATAKSN